MSLTQARAIADTLRARPAVALNDTERAVIALADEAGWRHD